MVLVVCASMYVWIKDECAFVCVGGQPKWLKRGGVYLACVRVCG